MHPLRHYRLRKGITLEALAQRVGTTRSWLSRIEGGKEQPSMSLVAKLKIVTNLSADDFLQIERAE